MGGSNATSQQPKPAAQKLTVAQILKQNAAAYVARYPGQAAPQVQSTLAKLSVCRTAALGGRKYQCSGCRAVQIMYNSCADRNCPTCSGARRSNWLESAAELIFDGVDHFQVVFTLPAALSSLSLGNRRVIYNLLFHSSWESLKQTIAHEHGYEAAAAMVLHTWNQKLEAHAHIHAVVPGCGPTKDGSGIRYAQRDGDKETIGKYLVDAEVLRTAFREAFLHGLARLRKRGELKLQGAFAELQTESGWRAFESKLQGVHWVSFIQAPPQRGQSAAHVLKYLARYLTGGPIADSRIVSTGDGDVTFVARAGEVSGGQRKQMPFTLSQIEFTRRWSLHILPSGFTRTRRYGGWSNTNRKRYLVHFAWQLQESGVLLGAAATDVRHEEESKVASWETASVDGPELIETRLKPCNVCGSSLNPHSERKKPSWAIVMRSSQRPNWYLHD